MSSLWVVDDSALERSVARRALERSYRIREFADGAAVLEALSGSPLPDVLLLDINLPSLSGLEVTRYLRERYTASELPILMLSGTYAASTDVVEGLRAGANDYLFKPYSSHELVARVDTLAEAQRQRARAERAERSLRQLLRTLPDPLLALDGASRISFVNAEAERVVGRDWTELVGRAIGDVIPALACLEERGEPAHVADFELGGRVYTPAFGRLFLDEQVGETTSITLRDVTEKALAIERRDRFLAMLAHELRNPLAPILSAMELMQRAAEPRAAERGRDIVHRQVERLIRIVDDLLDVSRVSRGRIDLSPEPVLVCEMVERAIESSTPLLQARGHHLEWQRPHEPLWVRADPVRFEQMLTNILNNACKYTDPGGHITLRAVAAGDACRITVRDTGIGIDPRMLEEVFDMFVQVDQSLHRSEGGLGIGLPLVRQLAELHGGSVTARSDGRGHGSEFALELPRSAPAERRAPKAAARGRARHLRILLVDDNFDAVSLLAEGIRMVGHTVSVAHSGPEAIDAARASKPDIVFLDIGLPGLDGYEVARRLRADATLDGTHLIALTGYGRSEDVARAHAAGFDRHLVKPVPLDGVEAIIAEHAGA